MMRALISLIITLCCLYSVNSVASDQFINIAVLAHRGNETALKRWSPTADYLSQHIPGYQFVIKPKTLAGMRKAAENREVDFILTNPGNYVYIEATYGATRIATLKIKQREQTYTSFSAVIFTRKDRDDIQTLNDLVDKSFMAVSENAFGGFQMAWLELKQVDIDPFEDLSSLEFSGFPQDNIVYAVLSGDVDAGTVRSDTLERMAHEGAIKLDQFKILNAQHDDSFPLLHSTRLYPEWPFSKLKHTDDKLAQQVAIALLTMPADSEAARVSRTEGWTIPLDYTPVHDLFRTLQIGPYADLGIVTFEKVIQHYGYYILLIILTLITLTVAIIYVSRVNQHLNQSQTALRIEIDERKRIQAELAQHRDTLELNVRKRTRELAELNEELQEDIIARKRAEGALKKSSRTLQTLHEITSSRHMSFEGKVDALLRTGSNCFDLHFGLLSQIKDAQYHVWRFVGEHTELQRGMNFQTKEMYAGIFNIDSEALLIADASIPPWQDHPCHLKHNWQSYMGIPVVVAGKLYGSLEFGSDIPKTTPFSPIDFEMLQLIAQWLGGEIEHQLTQEQSQKHQADLAHVARLSTMGEMASGLAHELNQPLTAIVNYTRGCVRRLSEASPDMPAILSAMERSASESERAAEIIRRMRELVSNAVPYREKQQINDIINVVIGLIQPEIRRNRINFKRQLSDNLNDIFVDRIQIEQVLINLIINGIDAMQDTSALSREIIVESKQSGEGVEVRVYDRGCGLPEEMQSDVFEPFFSTKNKGMGMGLSISRSIIEAHGGLLKAETREGGGSIFSFILPKIDEVSNE